MCRNVPRALPIKGIARTSPTTIGYLQSVLEPRHAPRRQEQSAPAPDAYLTQQGVSDAQIIYINKESMEWDFICNDTDLYRYINGRIDAASGKPYLYYRRGPGGFRLGVHAGRTVVDDPDEFRLYLRYGGLPAVHALSRNDATVFPYLNALYSTIVLKDVVSRSRIQNPGQLDRIVRCIFDNAGNITTAKRITDFLRNQEITAGVDKVLHYLGCLEQAFLIRRVLRYDIKGLRHLELYEKYYVGDVGLRHGFLGYRDGDINGLLENIVYLELLHRTKQ